MVVLVMVLLFLGACGRQMTVADESELNHGTNIVLTVQSVSAESVTVEIANHSLGKFEYYDKEFKLQQEMDGVWYDLEGDWQGEEKPAYLNYVGPKERVIETYDATIYGGIKEGYRYRIVISKGHYAEFELEER